MLFQSLNLFEGHIGFICIELLKKALRKCLILNYFVFILDVISANIFILHKQIHEFKILDFTLALIGQFDADQIFSCEFEKFDKNRPITNNCGGLNYTKNNLNGGYFNTIDNFNLNVLSNGTIKEDLYLTDVTSICKLNLKLRTEEILKINNSVLL